MDLIQPIYILMRMPEASFHCVNEFGYSCSWRGKHTLTFKIYDIYAKQCNRVSLELRQEFIISDENGLEIRWGSEYKINIYHYLDVLTALDIKVYETIIGIPTAGMLRMNVAIINAMILIQP